MISNFKNLAEFKKHDPEGYLFAQKQELIGKLCLLFNWTLINGYKPDGYWTYHNCYNDASQHNLLEEWQNKSNRAYTAAKRKGFFNKICTELGWEVKEYKPNGYWTKARVSEQALRFNTRWEWQKKHQSSYNVAKLNGWLDELCGHMKPMKMSHSKSDCKQDALHYNNRGEWAKQSHKTYNCARIHGWLDECCIHMIKLEKPLKIKKTRKVYIKDEIGQISKQYKTRKDWRENNNSSYQWAKRKGWLKDFTTHMIRPVKPKKHTKEKCLKAALNFERPTIWKIKDLQTYRAAYQNGWLKECCVHMKNKQFKSSHTEIDCFNNARQFKSKKEWERSHRSSYRKACKMGWIEKCCKHMKK
jgi:hypothetical protein